MKLIDRYIVQKFFATFLLTLSIFTCLIIIIHAAENVTVFKKHNLSFGQVFNYYCMLMPYMVNLLAPIIVFGTTIWVTTRLARRSEIIALLSGGVSFNRVITPYLIIGLLLTGANFYLTGWMLASANKERIKFETQYFDFYTEFSSRSDDLQLKVGPNQYLHITKYHSYNNTGYDVSLDTFKDNALAERLQAQKIKWLPSDQKWIFYTWQKRVFFPDYETLSSGRTLQIALEVHPEDFEINPNLREGLTLPELALHIQKLIYKGSESVRFFIAEQHIRYMSPFAIIILIILGFLVAVNKPRGGVGRRITLGFVLACFYIVLFLSAKIVAETQSEHPILDIWLPNIIFSLLCLIFYRLVPK